MRQTSDAMIVSMFTSARAAVFLKFGIPVSTVVLVPQRIFVILRSGGWIWVCVRQLARRDRELPVVVSAVSTYQMQHLMNRSIDILLLPIVDPARRIIRKHKFRTENYGPASLRTETIT